MLKEEYDPPSFLQDRPHVGPYRNLSEFVIVQELYRSNSGAVLKARVKKTGLVVVLKQRKSAELGRQDNILHEFELLHRLNHPNVIRTFGYFWDPSYASLFIVLEYADHGDLYAEIQKRAREHMPFSEEELWQIFYQICAGVHHLHEHRIIHRDLKPLNLLLTVDRSIKVSDLGVGRELGPETMFVQTFYGTPRYLSPELCENKEYSEKTDVWSLGVLLYELAALEPPFAGRNLIELAQCVVQGIYAPLPKTYSRRVSSLVSQLLQRDPERRPDLQWILSALQSLPEVQKSNQCQWNHPPTPSPPIKEVSSVVNRVTRETTRRRSVGSSVHSDTDSESEVVSVSARDQPISEPGHGPVRIQVRRRPTTSSSRVVAKEDPKRVESAFDPVVVSVSNPVAVRPPRPQHRKDRSAKSNHVEPDFDQDSLDEQEDEPIHQQLALAVQIAKPTHNPAHEGPLNERPQLQAESIQKSDHPRKRPPSAGARRSESPTVQQPVNGYITAQHSVSETAGKVEQKRSENNHQSKLFGDVNGDENGSYSDSKDESIMKQISPEEPHHEQKAKLKSTPDSESIPYGINLRRVSVSSRRPVEDDFNPLQAVMDRDSRKNRVSNEQIDKPSQNSNRSTVEYEERRGRRGEEEDNTHQRMIERLQKQVQELHSEIQRIRPSPKVDSTTEPQRRKVVEEPLQWSPADQRSPVQRPQTAHESSMRDRRWQHRYQEHLKGQGVQNCLDHRPDQQQHRVEDNTRPAATRRVATAMPRSEEPPEPLLRDLHDKAKNHVPAPAENNGGDGPVAKKQSPKPFRRYDIILGKWIS
eukprot:GILJ01010622.1.p1 GENE.GILJ01010622.1~~GILJ01010622.1.p1  ORF type:complete len:812 (+),score=109.75 GILJ01010622.1:69-2504(+)